MDKELAVIAERLEEILKVVTEHIDAERSQQESQRDRPIALQPVKSVISYDNQTKGEIQTGSNRQYRVQNSVRWAAWFAFSAAVVYAGISVLMWCQMIKQTRIAAESQKESIRSFRMDERAWVELEPIQGALFTPKTDKFGATFRYAILPKNVGKTVATSVQMRALRNGMSAPIEFGDDPKQVSFEQDQLLLGRAINQPKAMPIITPIPQTLGPQSTSPIPVFLNGQEPMIFRTGETVFYIIGRIDYSDAFGVSHWKKFCYFVANFRGELLQCKEGNDEDKNPEGPN